MHRRAQGGVDGVERRSLSPTSTLGPSALHAQAPRRRAADHGHANRLKRGAVPPGLAKKGDLPPGQAKKLWGKGETLPRAYIAPSHYVEPIRYRLPPPPYGDRWVVVDGRAYLVRTETGLIMDVVSDLLSRR